MDHDKTSPRSVMVAPVDTASETLEAERRRLAHHVEETLVSQTNLILAQINAYEQAADSAQSRLAFSVLASLTRQLLQAAHDLTANLHPAALETLGLAAALESLVNQQKRSTGADISLALPHLRERLPAALELVLFRFAQSAITRAIQQGGASTVRLVLAFEDGGLVFSAADNGRGPTDTMLRASRQHVESLGGTFTVGESRYGGAAVTVRFTLLAPADLTAREIEVIGWVAQGLSNKEVAARLNVQPRTIKFHLDNIYAKLGINNRTEAAVYALRHGWANKPPSE